MRVGHAASDIADHIQGRLIGPMGILDDHHRRAQSAGEQIDHRPEHSDPLTPLQGVEQRCVVVGHIPQRSQRSRGEQIVAATPQHVRVSSDLRHEPSRQRGLSDPGLATNQGNGARAVSGALPRVPELLQLALTLEKLHHRQSYP